jgi:hypothetical protein
MRPTPINPIVGLFISRPEVVDRESVAKPEG